MEHNNLYLGLVMPSSGWYSPISHTAMSLKSGLDIQQARIKIKAA